MKNLITGLTIVALTLWASMVFAGDFHVGSTLVCSDCHTMHYSLTHDYSGGTSPTTTSEGAGQSIWLGSNTTGGNGNQKLLKAADNELCLQCHHGKSFAPDVLGANSNGYVREAGGLNQTGVTEGDGYYNYMGHTLGATTLPPGGTGNFTPDPTAGLRCIDCHSQHGSATQFRNLQSHVGSVSGLNFTYAVGTNNLNSADVFELVGAGSAMASHYGVGNVSYNRPAVTVNNTGSNVSNWCKACHTDFHGAVGDTSTIGGSITAGGFNRHPAGGVNIGAVGASLGATYYSNMKEFVNGASSGVLTPAKTNFAKVMDPTGGNTMNADGTWVTAPNTANQYTPNCLTCHKAHGNKNAFGLIEMENTGAITEEGTANGGEAAKNLCKQCHIQG